MISESGKASRHRFSGAAAGAAEARGRKVAIFTAIGFALGFAAGSLRTGQRLAPPASRPASRGETSAARANAAIRPTRNASVTYGLLHMAKTAGTEINGELAMHYERVCGNKGYSYDYFQTNRRFEEASAERNCTATMGCVRDSLTGLKRGTYKLMNRGIVSDEWMDEVGYEDCDYIAKECDHKFWEDGFLKVGGPAIEKELHVLCRADPVDHLMSMCSHKGKTFDCAKPLRKQIGRCVMTMGRFSDSLLDRRPNFTVKCVAAIPIEPYLQRMSGKLQRRRVEGTYVRRQTMHKVERRKQDECVWKNDTLRNRVEEILINSYSYFSFCKRCLGSKNDLLHDAGEIGGNQ